MVQATKKSLNIDQKHDNNNPNYNQNNTENQVQHNQNIEYNSQSAQSYDPNTINQPTLQQNQNYQIQENNQHSINQSYPANQSNQNQINNQPKQI